MFNAISKYEFMVNEYWLRWFVVTLETPKTPEGLHYTAVSQMHDDYYMEIRDYLDTIEYRYHWEVGSRYIAFEDREDALMFRLRYG